MSGSISANTGILCGNMVREWVLERLQQEAAPSISLIDINKRLEAVEKQLHRR